MTTDTIQLLDEKRKIEERKLGLQKYEMELRKVIGRIGEITYRKWESREQERQSLQAQKRTITAGLKADYNLTPARISYQIREYDHALFEISRKLDSIEHQEKEPSPDYDRER